MACVTDFLLETCDPEAVALYTDDGQATYGDVARSLSQVAAHLCSLGQSRGSRAILIGDNSPFWVGAYLGTLRAGWVSVPLPTTVTPSELSRIIELTEANVALVDVRLLAKHSNVLRSVNLVTDRRSPKVAVDTAITLDELRISPDAPAAPPVSSDDLAALMLTSGSTRVPRGVMVTHGNIIANTQSIIESLRLTSADRMMTVLPFSYCFGTSLLHTHLRVGGSLVLDARFMYPEVVLERMEQTECTGFAGVPSHFQILLANSTIRQRSFKRLRHVQQAGGRLAPPVIDELRAALPRAQIFTMYGQTEATARLSCLSPELLDAKRGSIGKGIPGVRLSVLNETGREVAPGEVGEIVAEGDNITKGYWRAPEESRETFRNGRLHTGDLATVDDEGFIFIVGREKDFIKCRGERVSSLLIEEKLLEHPAVLEAAVVPMPDDVLGEAVKAFVVPRATADAHSLAGTLREFYSKRMPAHLVPREIVVLAELPKSASGKVSKRRLTAAS